jgi:hypothetical protein
LTPGRIFLEATSNQETDVMVIIIPASGNAFKNFRLFYEGRRLTKASIFFKLAIKIILVKPSVERCPSGENLDTLPQES